MKCENVYLHDCWNEVMIFHYVRRSTLQDPIGSLQVKSWEFTTNNRIKTDTSDKNVDSFAVQIGKHLLMVCFLTFACFKHFFYI